MKNQNNYFQRVKNSVRNFKNKIYNLIDIEDFGYKFHINFNENSRKKYLRLNNYLSMFSLLIYNYQSLILLSIIQVFLQTFYKDI